MTLATQPPPTAFLADLPTGSLKIDPTYQRHLSKTRVDKMAKEWNDALAGALEVSSRNGHYFVLDGQHRLLAARQAGVTHMTVIIHEGLSQQEEAARFAILNTARTRPGAYDIFRARKQAQEPLVLEILNVCHRNGVPVVYGGKHGYGTYAVNTLEQVAKHSLGLLDQTLRIASQAWPGDPVGVSAVPITGIAAFIYVYGSHPAYSEKKLVEKLAAFPASHLVQRAKEIGSGGASAGNATSFNKLGARQAVWELWNRKLRNPLPMATYVDMKYIQLGRNPWRKDASA